MPAGDSQDDQNGLNCCELKRQNPGFTVISGKNQTDLGRARISLLRQNKTAGKLSEGQGNPQLIRQHVHHLLPNLTCRDRAWQDRVAKPACTGEKPGLSHSDCCNAEQLLGC